MTRPRDTTSDPGLRPPSSPRAMRWLWVSAGSLCLGLGLIGALLPVMPTTVFVLMAAGCFAKGSPELYQRLVQHERFGPAIVHWRRNRAISKRGKTYATLGIAGSIGLSAAALGPGWGAVSLVAFAVALCAWLLTRPTAPPRILAQAHDPRDGACRDTPAVPRTGADAA